MRRLPGPRALVPTLLLAVAAPLMVLPSALPSPALAAGAMDGPLLPDDGGFTPFSWGLKGGLALAQHQGTEERDSPYTVSSTMRRGAAGGVFITLPITRRFSLQQEVLYVQKGSDQDIGVDVLELPTVLDVRYEMDYLEIPLLLRYAWLIDRGVDLYTLGGFGFGLKLRDRYRLAGQLDDGEQTVDIRADADMSEVDLFDFFFTYGVGLEVPVAGGRWLLEYRFDLSLQQLPLPTYAVVPFGEDELVVENDPVPLRNQCHMLLMGIRF
jgi:hypothetical protein